KCSHSPCPRPRWTCTQVSESRGTSLRLAQLRQGPTTGSRRNPARGEAYRRKSWARRPFDELTLFLHEEATNHKHVHAGAEESTHRVRRRVHDGFAPQV